MATSKTLTPTNVTIFIPEFTDQPDQRVNSNCIDKEADAINALNTAIANLVKSVTVTGTTDANGNLAISTSTLPASSIPILAKGNISSQYFEVLYASYTSSYNLRVSAWAGNTPYANQGVTATIYYI